MKKHAHTPQKINKTALIDHVSEQLANTLQSAKDAGYISLSFKEKAVIFKDHIDVTILNPKATDKDNFPLADIEHPLASAFVLVGEFLKANNQTDLQSIHIGKTAKRAEIKAAEKLDLI